MNELSELGKAAVAYAEAGIAIIPLKPRGKEPYIKGGSTKATANVEQVRKHWLGHPDDNIAIVCGGVSDGLIAIDVDCHGEVDGWDTLAEFEADRPLPAAPTSITGSGGGHMLYRSAEAVRNGVGSDTGIDVRGEGGYIVAPPSIHPNGTAYRWETSPLDMDIPEADANVLALVESIRPVGSDTAKLTMPDVIHEGEGRDNALYKLACSQRANNLPYETALVTVMDYNQRCCVPPMSERVVRQKVDSAYRHAPGHSEKVRMAEKAGDENKPKRGRPRKFDHAKVAERLVTERGACLVDGKTPAVRDSNGHYALGVGSVQLGNHRDGTGLHEREPAGGKAVRPGHGTKQKAKPLEPHSVRERRARRADDGLPRVLRGRYDSKRDTAQVESRRRKRSGVPHDREDGGGRSCRTDESRRDNRHMHGALVKEIPILPGAHRRRKQRQIHVHGHAEEPAG